MPSAGPRVGHTALGWLDQARLQVLPPRSVQPGHSLKAPRTPSQGPRQVLCRARRENTFRAVLAKLGCRRAPSFVGLGVRPAEGRLHIVPELTAPSCLQCSQTQCPGWGPADGEGWLVPPATPLSQGMGSGQRGGAELGPRMGAPSAPPTPASAQSPPPRPHTQVQGATCRSPRPLGGKRALWWQEAASPSFVFLTGGLKSGRDQVGPQKPLRAQLGPAVLEGCGPAPQLAQAPDGGAACPLPAFVREGEARPAASTPSPNNERFVIQKQAPFVPSALRRTKVLRANTSEAHSRSPARTLQAPRKQHSWWTQGPHGDPRPSPPETTSQFKDTSAAEKLSVQECDVLVSGLWFGSPRASAPPHPKVGGGRWGPEDQDVPSQAPRALSPRGRVAAPQGRPPAR